MKLKSVTIENYRAIGRLTLPLDPSLTVFHGDNTYGKTSILSAIAVGLGRIPTLLPGVSGIDFRQTDRRGWQPLRVALTTTEEVAWERRRTFGQITQRMIVQRSLKEVVDAIVSADRDERDPLNLPIVAFYDTDRAVFDPPRRRRGFKTEFTRYAALEGALSARTDFKDFFQWFHAKENEELRAQRIRRNFDFRMKDLEAVRRAITSMIPGATEPHTELNPLRFMVSLKLKSMEEERLSLDQLSGGYRNMLALSADLARRMAQGNPHLTRPLASEAIVLIDEVELHLHPSWQQRVLKDLLRTFPNTQFIVSTHSPQVLTTVRPEHIVTLQRKDGQIVAGKASTATYGAEAGDVLFTVMGVDERPHENEFVELLEEYRGLITRNQGESRAAVSLRRELEKLSPYDPALDRADIEIRRRKILKDMGKP